MLNKPTKKVILDIVMSFLFILLLDAYGTGLVFHEIVGMVIVGLFALHLVINRSWIIQVSKRLFSPTLSLKNKGMYALNISLLLAVLTITLTGVLISQVLFPFRINADNSVLIYVHILASYAALCLIGIHLALHWRFLHGITRMLLFNREFAWPKRMLRVTGSLTMLGVMIYSIYIPLTGSEVIAAPLRVQTSQSGNIQKSNGSFSGNASSGNISSSISGSQSSTKSVSLNNFLGSMFCTACPKHCPLTNLRCNKGNSQLQAAKVKYQSLYGQTS